MTEKSGIDEAPQTEKETAFVIGAGHFGERAVRILHERGGFSIHLVDTDEEQLRKFTGLDLETVKEDGIGFLVSNFSSLKSEDIIVPALPRHLAAEWVKRRLGNTFSIKNLETPSEIEGQVPHAWKGSEGSLLVSYADFICPDDCPEPEFCTVTGERRDKPLFNILRNLEISDCFIHIIRSHQLAPGLGGYRVSGLAGAEDAVKALGKGRVILGTSCRCHGILTTLEIEDRRQETHFKEVRS